MFMQACEKCNFYENQNQTSGSCRVNTPIVLKDDNKAYALRFVGMNDVNHSTAWLKMNKSKNIDEWLDALRMEQLASLNLVYADKEDNIFFVHNVKSPIRDNNFDWSKILPGDRSDLIWKDFHSFDDIPQIKNPNSGYLFSANQNPFFVTDEEDNLNPEDFSDTFGFQTRTTNRAYRSYELLNRDTDITYEEISLIKHDNKFSYNSIDTGSYFCPQCNGESRDGFLNNVNGLHFS